jgi:hypothetical protein
VGIIDYPDAHSVRVSGGILLFHQIIIEEGY